jgi:hypothetical protein
MANNFENNIRSIYDFATKIKNKRLKKKLHSIIQLSAASIVENGRE